MGRSVLCLQASPPSMASFPTPQFQHTHRIEGPLLALCLFWSSLVPTLVQGLPAIPPFWPHSPQPQKAHGPGPSPSATATSLHMTSLTLKQMSVVMVKPWVIMGSSSGGFPFQQSSSTQRQPASSTWRYISAEERPENWPAEPEEGRGAGASLKGSPALPRPTPSWAAREQPPQGIQGAGTAPVKGEVGSEVARAHLSGRCCGRS